MQDLIERIEKATGPDAQLDGAIYCAINGLEFVSTGKDGTIHFKPDAAGTRAMVTPHPYTASLDQAVELVPAGLYWVVGFGKEREAEPMGGAVVIHPGNTLENEIGKAEAATVPLALCAAALKARAVVGA